MTSAIFQEALMAHILDLKSKALNVITSGPAASNKTVQKHLFFIDDLNTVFADHYGTLFTIERLKQILDYKNTFHLEDIQQLTELKEFLICASFNPKMG